MKPFLSPVFADPPLPPWQPPDLSSELFCVHKDDIQLWGAENLTYSSFHKQGALCSHITNTFVLQLFTKLSLCSSHFSGFHSLAKQRPPQNFWPPSAHVFPALEWHFWVYCPSCPFLLPLNPICSFSFLPVLFLSRTSGSPLAFGKKFIAYVCFFFSLIYTDPLLLV